MYVKKILKSWSTTELSGVKNVTLFSYKQLRIATDDFSTLNKIGEGGFGSVYKVMTTVLLLPCYELGVRILYV